ncbi:hypothetical protein [Xanthobacter sp. KR7-225]|uniref:hypothetical protein n=1 Tax=Xanthobacter sp. KR7-225 TaxID=3156613 RepID=UPI0032B53349
MSTSLRFFAFPDDLEIKLFPKALLDDCVFGERTVPEFAGKRVRFAECVIEMDGRQPLRLLDVRGSWWSFDGNGVYESDPDALRYLFSHLDNPNRDGPIVDISPVIERRQWQERHRWTPTVDQIELIARAIWPRRGEDERVGSVQGGGPKSQPVSSDARRAVQTIHEAIFTIENALEDLSEHSLKGVLSELRKQARHFKAERAISEGVANRVEEMREIQRRRRSGKGTWYAVVEVFRWDERRKSGESIQTFSEACDGKAKALEKAREMLALHAHLFGDRITLEASVSTDLEWQEVGEE